MKLKSLWGFLPIFCLLVLSVDAQENRLSLGSSSAEFGSQASVDLTLDSIEGVQGLVATFDWDDTNITGVALNEGAVLAIQSADTVVTRIESNFAIIGIVMDTNPSDNSPSSEIIPAGSGTVIATLVVQCGGGPAASTTAIEFRDGAYATVDPGPALDNIIVVGGTSVGGDPNGSGDPREGLQFTNGQVRCTPTPPKFFIEDGINDVSQPPGDDACGDAKVLMRNQGEVEGYVIALCHNPADLTLMDIAVGADAANAGVEFMAPEIFANGGTLGVVLDFNSPFTGQTIPVGAANEIAVYSYCCVTVPEASMPDLVTALTFCDNVLGDPVKENVMVIGGISISKDEDLALENGTFTCTATGPLPAEDCNDGIDNDGDTLIDGDDPECQQMFACGDRVLSGDGEDLSDFNVGSNGELCLYLKSPEDNAVGHAQMDHVQGFSMAISHCCDITFQGDLDISGTILEAIGAEFISVQIDSTEDDGDGCELIVGVLVDALPPFDGATIPPMANFQLMGCLEFTSENNSDLCGTCCDVTFEDNLNGNGKVPVKNLISAENMSVGPQLMNCKICFTQPAHFYRGDCNFKGMGPGMMVDIADAAAVVSFLFMPGSWKFQPPCLDACDCNDDGRVDLADAICILQYYLQGGTFPPAPGPGLVMDENGGVVPSGAGPDWTEDKLDCIGDGDCPD